MTDINTDPTINGSGSKAANGHADDANGVDAVKDPSAVLAKNKELVDLIRKEKQSKGELLQKIQEIEQAKLQAEGKKDELISNLQTEIKKLRTDYTSTKTKYALKTVKDQVAVKAAQLGCVNVDDLTRLMDLESLQVSVVDDDYKVDEETLASQLERMRREKSYLFKQAGPQIKDGMPTNQQQKLAGVDFSKMSTAELKKWALENKDKIK